MKGQLRALIPAVIGIAPLLLAGIVGYVQNPGEQPATDSETRTHAYTDSQQLTLAEQMRSGADVAATQIAVTIAADLALEVENKPVNQVASTKVAGKERG